VEEDVAVSTGAENNTRSVSVVQAIPEDTFAELLDSDRPQPVGVYPAANQLMMDAMRGGTEVQAMSAVMYRPKLLWFAKSEDEENRLIDRAFNALLAGAAISYAFTKAVTVDHDVWHGWTMFEVLKYAPLHSWHAYEDVLQSNPILAKMTISGIVYSIGDWIGQCVEGKPVLEFSRVRLLRSGLVGFCLHGSLSHHYYHVCEFLFPFQGWWVVPLKVAFDQTIWSAIWNSIYFVTLGLLRFESPVRIFKDLRETFFPCLTAGWKLWPFAHLITYGLIPVEQRLLWVDCVEIVWVTILSMFANEKAQQRLESGEESVLVLVGKEGAEENASSNDSQ
jgi:protein Mpv17